MTGPSNTDSSNHEPMQNGTLEMDELRQEPSHDQWLRLYELTIMLRNTAPWRWMAENQLFAVQHPDTKEIGYCSLTGQTGGLPALVVYPGPEGFASYQQVMKNELDYSVDETTFLQKAIVLSFESAADLELSDKQIIEAVGLSLKEYEDWQLFRSYEPGYVPLPLTAEEAGFLTLIIQQTLDVAHAIRNRQLEIEKDAKTDESIPTFAQIYTRIQQSDGKWVGEYQPLPNVDDLTQSAKLDFLDELAIRRVRNKGIQTGIWELDYTFAPFVVKEGNRPAFPRMLMIVCQETGKILNVHISPEPTYVEEFAAKFFETMERNQVYPKQLVTKRGYVAELILPITEALKIDLVLVPTFARLEEARDQMYESFKNA